MNASKAADVPPKVPLMFLIATVSGAALIFLASSSCNCLLLGVAPVKLSIPVSSLRWRSGFSFWCLTTSSI